MRAPVWPSGTLREFLKRSFPAAGGSISLVHCTWMWNYLTTPAVPTPHPSIPAPVAAARNATGSLHLAQFALIKALLRDASICLFPLQMLMPVDCICPNNPCDTGDRGWQCEEQSLANSVRCRFPDVGNRIKEVHTYLYWHVYHFYFNKNTTLQKKERKKKKLWVMLQDWRGQMTR